jgi:hypothetical protein
MLGFGGQSINCTTAVSAIGGPLNVGISWGFAASAKVLRHFSQWMPGYPKVDRQTSEILKLDRYTNAANLPTP